MRQELRTVVGDLGHGLCVCTNDGLGGRVDIVRAVRAGAWLVERLERAGREGRGGRGGSKDRQDQGRRADDLAQHV